MNHRKAFPTTELGAGGDFVCGAIIRVDAQGLAAQGIVMQPQFDAREYGVFPRASIISNLTDPEHCDAILDRAPISTDFHRSE